MFQCCMPACLDTVGGMNYGNYEKTFNAYLSKYIQFTCRFHSASPTLIEIYLKVAWTNLKALKGYREFSTAIIFILCIILYFKNSTWWIST